MNYLYILYPIILICRFNYQSFEAVTAIGIFWLDIKEKIIKGTKMVCLSEFDHEILLKNATLKECENFIKEHSEDVYLVPGGYKVKGLVLHGYNRSCRFFRE